MGVPRPEEIGPAFSAVSRAHAQALYIIEDPLFFTHRMTLVKSASKVRLPIIHGYTAFTDEGGLMSYGVNYGDTFRPSGRVRRQDPIVWRDPW